MVRDQERDKTLKHIWQQYQESEEGELQTPSCGRGYVCHADRYFAQRFLKKQPERRPGECLAGVRDHRSQSTEPSHGGWPTQPGSDGPQGLYAHREMLEKAGQGHPLGGGHLERVSQEFRDAFHSAQEDQSDTASDSDSETEDWDDIIAYDTETSRNTEVADQEHRRVHDHRRTNKRQRHEWCPGYGKAKWLSLPIFWDSTSDNAITYDDWRSDVDNFVWEGHPTRLIRDSVLCVLEGHPHYTTKTVMDDRDSSLRSIMEVLDSVYGGATMYSAPMSKLNTVQQGNGKSAKDYYEHVVQIRVKLQEFHHYMFRPGDLEYRAKNAFFNRLRPEYQAMVIHKRDDPQTSITHLLIAMWECEENEAQHCRSRWAEYTKAYPPSRSKPPYRTNNTDPHQWRPDNSHQDQTCYHQQDNNGPNITIHATQVELAMEIEAEEDYIPPYIDYDNALQDRDDVELTFHTEVYVAIIRMADDTEWQDNRCYNCKEKGHFWHQCTKPLKEEFQRLLNRPKQREKELNKKGGPGTKGGWVPQPMPAVVPVPALAAAAPQ